jgi:hypothetical protein
VTVVVENVEAMSKTCIVGCKVAELARFVTRAGNIVELSPHSICWGSCQTIILQIIKGLFVSATEVPFTINGGTVVKTPNTQSMDVPLIRSSVDFLMVPLTFCIVLDQFSKKANLKKKLLSR